MPKPWKPVWNGSDWQIDFRVKGRRVRRRLGIRDAGLEAVARKEARRLYEAEWQRPAVEVAGTPFWRAAKAYTDAGGEARFLPRIMTYFGHTAIEDIGEVEIAAAGAELYPDASPATVRRQCRVPIKAVVRFARGERRQQGTDTPRTRWLEPEEAERLITCAGRILPVVAFLLGSGCRTGEAFALDRKDWRPETRQAFIADPKNGHPRWVQVPARSLQLMGEMPEVGALFRTPKGLPYVLREKGGGQIQGAFNRARELAGLGPDVTPHSCRHSWATWFYAQTGDFGRLMDLGGWRKADMANRYRKLAPADLAERLWAHGWDFTGRAPAPRGRMTG